jgi:hypothetical protein
MDSIEIEHTINKILNNELVISNEEIVTMLSNKTTLQNFLELASIPYFCPLEWLAKTKLINRLEPFINWSWVINYNSNSCIISMLLLHNPINWKLVNRCCQYCSLTHNLSQSDIVSSNIVTLLSSLVYMNTFVPMQVIQTLVNRIKNDPTLHIHFSNFGPYQNKIPTSNIYYFLSFLYEKTNDNKYKQMCEDLQTHYNISFSFITNRRKRKIDEL